MLTWKCNYKPQEVLEREPDHVPRDLGRGPGSHCPPKGLQFNHFPGLKRSSPISTMGITSPAGHHSLAASGERSREREGRQQGGSGPAVCHAGARGRVQGQNQGAVTDSQARLKEAQLTWASSTPRGPARTCFPRNPSCGRARPCGAGRAKESEKSRE